MFRDLIDTLLHRYIRSGDLLMFPQRSTKERYLVDIEGSGRYACVRLRSGNRAIGIRRDLPRWSDYYGCWVYSGD